MNCRGYQWGRWRRSAGLSPKLGGEPESCQLRCSAARGDGGGGGRGLPAAAAGDGGPGSQGVPLAVSDDFEASGQAVASALPETP